MLENIVDNPLAPASHCRKPGLGIPWCTVQLDWWRAACALALRGTPVRLLTAYHAPSRRPSQQQDEYQPWGSARRHEHHERDRRPYRLSQPSSAAAHPTDSSPLLIYLAPVLTTSFYSPSLPSVTATLIRERGIGGSPHARELPGRCASLRPKYVTQRDPD